MSAIWQVSIALETITLSSEIVLVIIIQEIIMFTSDPTPGEEVSQVQMLTITSSLGIIVVTVFPQAAITHLLDSSPAGALPQEQATSSWVIEPDI